MIKTFVAALAAALFFAAPAAAQFGDCMDPDYLLNFGERDAGADPYGPIQEITCVEEFRIDYLMPRGERHIRGIRDINGDWGFRPGALEQVEAGARAAVEAMKELGDFEIDDITILILDDAHDPLGVPRPSDAGNVAALTSGDPMDVECYITIYMFGPTGVPREVAYSIAHEIFHCIQNATLTIAQNDTATGDGAWWAEGSAEYFATLALPEGGDVFNRAAAFERGVAAEAPLYDYTYSMAVFFYWLHHRQGAAQLMPFLHRMATTNSDAAQRAAMLSVLSPDEWLDFVEAYADRSITGPAGQTLAFSGADGDTIAFSNSRTESFTLEPFVIRRGWISFECGAWRNTLSPGDVNLEARREDSRDWAALPNEVDTEEAPELRYRYAAFNTDDASLPVTLEVNRTRSCEPCAGSEEIDRCVVGDWKMTGGGPIEWMRAQGLPIVTADPGERVVRFDEKGVYYAQGFGAQMTMEFDDERADATGGALPAAGRWSIADGKLAVCQDSGGMSGVVTTQHGSIPVEQAGGGVLLQDYSCSRTTLETRLDMGGGPPMSTTYTKIGGPAEERP